MTEKGKPHPWFSGLTPEQVEEFKADWRNLERFPTPESLLEKYGSAGTISKLNHFAYRVCRLINRRLLEKERQAMVIKNEKALKPQPQNGEIKIAEILQNLPLEDRKWDDPEVLEIDAGLWSQPGQRIGRLSRIDFFSDGFRRGVLKKNCEILAYEEGVHFIVINAGLIDKASFKLVWRERLEEVKQHVKEEKKIAKERGRKIENVLVKAIGESVLNNLLNEAAKKLAAILPRLKKPTSPGSSSEFIRYYISTSPRYDGPFGEEIAKRLQQLRPEDIRCFKAGSACTKVKGANKRIWSISPVRARIPGKYYSQSAEKEIEDKEGQTSQPLPDLWAVGGQGSAIYKGEGERGRAYLTDPASCRQEKVTIGENQVGIAVVEYPPPDSNLVPGTVERLVRFWSLRDLIACEKEFITGIKEGSQRIHRSIVEILKQEGALSTGQICDELGIDDRKKVEEALKFLVEEKASPRKTWPGLHYDDKAQLFDFHLDWLQDRLRYVLPKKSEWKEDRFLFTGCLHSGYTTVDYEFIVKQLPYIMQKRKTKTLISLGDEIAGLHHGFQCRGEIFSSLNNTEQERFAAELRAEVIFQAFKNSFEQELIKQNPNTLTLDQLTSLINKALVLFLVIPGNHDLWQEEEGNTPLAMFITRLRELLCLYLRHFLLEKKILLPIDLEKIVEAKTLLFPDTEAVYEMPSGIKVAMAHPHLGRAATTSLRAQHAIGLHQAQISGIANFHTATVVHKWNQDLGQCVSVQVGTHAIHTRFERRKMKFQVDFGPVALRVVSHNGRILMTETVYYNKPYLRTAILKSQDIQLLRKKLGLRCAALGLPLNISSLSGV